LSGPDIFLSYNREDAARARLFAEGLAAQGFAVWWDAHLRSGEAYDEVTEAALRAAKAVVVLWSKRSVASRWVRAEATLADRNKTLLPCMIEPCERPIMFELTQTAELAHWQGAADDRAWQAFLGDVRRFLERPVASPVEADQLAESLVEIAEAPPPPRETMVAVLPFDNLSSDAEMVYFSDGISEDILGRLARGSDLKVVGRAASFNFRGADKVKAADALKVTHLLDGSIRRAGNRVRIFVHLTETASQNTLWSERYDRELDDIFALQDEISEAIATALDSAFAPARTAKIDPNVYDHYLHIRAHMYEMVDLAGAVDSTTALVKLVPDFAEGWALHAATCAWATVMQPFAERASKIAEAHEAIARCLALDPGCPTVFGPQWILCQPFGQYLEQEQAAQKMMEHWQRSGVAEFALAYHLENVGRLRAANAVMREFADRGSQSLNFGGYHGMVVWRMGRFAEGRAMLEESLTFFPGQTYVRATLVGVYLQAGDFAALDRLLDPAVLARYPLREYSWLCDYAAMARDRTPEKYRAFLDRMHAEYASSGAIEPYLITIWSDFGSIDEAYALAESVRFGPSGGPGDVMGTNAYHTHLLFSVTCQNLRADPRFMKVCARLGLVEYWLTTELWPDCADEVPYDFRAECAKYRDHPKDRFLP
jgi:TolB-like protein